MKVNERIYYVDRNGSYGDADGMLIIRERDLGFRGREKFEEAKDTVPNLREWAVGALMKVKQEPLVVEATGLVLPKGALEDLSARLKGVLEWH